MPESFGEMSWSPAGPSGGRTGVASRKTGLAPGQDENASSL